ncbi:hypothetical protein D6D17_04250 [Aureobasidium pullulans]|uniref:Transcription factor domain-containing protein n=1 Tax=Aureobasidium pullulans TaxID=5580 RepID=A0AB74IK44_AURPU|nr:hypothetical protein D6D21_09649 [Aureobasidium pullulans]THX08576.1 hypothetical protein D6D17_04250 [Aureobasidium pullulans]TIA53249.1 hypothetical protein D6C79_01603 [Aureobasidium pullulans]TIA65489.1 hypothetical protein D6C77_00725 [Aureobasidium pullulans]TIA75943.1 hypothetical protein D6C76_05874 [Aureobasidium pullulans]
MVDELNSTPCVQELDVCGQCTKASRQCVPSPGVVFRHQQNASMNGSGTSNADGGLKSFYGYKETFGKDSIWVDIPRQLTFVHTTNPYDDPDSSHFHSIPEAREPEPRMEQTWNATAEYPYPFMPSSTHGLEALSAAASGDHYFQNASRRTGAPEAFSPPIDPRLDTELSETCMNLFESGPDTGPDFDPKTDEDVPFLLRYFSEGPGEWMDLFDLGSFFAVDVPLKAAYSPLLLYASVALSAKALGRIRITAQHPKSSGSKRTPAEWSHKARYYYDQAITLLRQALENETRQASVGQHSPGLATTTSDSVGPRVDHHSASPPVLSRPDSDELIATTAILCVFEFLDASGTEWSRHLDGAKSLFDIAKDGTMPLSTTASDHSPILMPRSTTSTKGRRAVFWNICRQEMLNAFINNTSTRLDTTDLSMWRSAGLHISQAGYILPSNDSAVHEPMTDDMISNALIWLMMKLVNFISAGDEFPHEMGLGVRQIALLEYWEGLEQQLDVWFEGLPHSFRPSATEWPDKSNNDVRSATKVPRKWFARPMCASTMQSFHFAKIQLLLNKPHESTGTTHIKSSSTHSKGNTWSLAQRHASYASILRQSRKHAEEIVSIGLGLTNDSARIHSVQPLYTAGQVLGMRESNTRSAQTEEGHSPDEVDAMRGCILNLLQNIQRETGWATEYRMQQLLEEWGLPNGQD